MSLMEQKLGGGIVYRPPETLAEYLEGGLVPPVPGASTRNDARRTFFGEVSIEEAFFPAFSRCVFILRCVFLLRCGGIR